MCHCHYDHTPFRDLDGERAVVTGRQLERSYTDQIESVASEVMSMWGATRFISQMSLDFTCLLVSTCLLLQVSLDVTGVVEDRYWK